MQRAEPATLPSVERDVVRCTVRAGKSATSEWNVLNSFKLSESFKTVAEGVLEIFEEVYLGGGGGTIPPPPLPGWDRVKVFSETLQAMKISSL